jgi:hypothetical protein
MHSCIEKHAAALACPVQCASMMTSLAQEFPQLGLQDVSLSHLKQACVKASEYVTPTDLQDFCATLGHTYAQTSSPLVQMVARDARALSSASAASAPPHANAPVSSMPTVQVLPVHHLETVHHIQTPLPVAPVVMAPVPSVPSKAPSTTTASVPSAVPTPPQTQAPKAASGLQSLLDALNATTSK